MDQQVRRINAQYGLNLNEEEIQRIAREAALAESVLEALFEVDLDQTRPVMGIAKHKLARVGKRALR